ncbi:MAG: type I restriction endonuclease subunit R, partial [Thermoguttaceae bacterium]|nr:type I restriction endonuclease subunit R [Thermoguttaceae bacterium]
MPGTFTEQNIEDMVLHAIVANGWNYVRAEDLPRAESDVLVEKYLREALIRLNPCIAENPANADTVIYKLRALISTVRPHDLVTQNERFKKLIFEENSFPFDKDGRSISIRFFDYENPENNTFVVTNQWVYPQKNGGKRLDVVLLINGFPVAVGEMKSPVRPAISWMDGAGDILAYEKSIPQMFVTNILNFATEGKCFRYGAINAPVTLWGPWYANIPHEEGDLAKVQRAVSSITRKEVFLDLFRYFTLFSTDKHNRKIKIVCRYQQYEGANLIVERVKAGFPKKGLIWHFQGSGKSLLMVFAAQKLRMVKELNSPTVIIVNDRIDLSGQIFGTFSMADVPNLVPADTNAEMIRLLKADSRKVIITKIFEFAKINDAINFRDNIIVMVDEAHRTQEGDLGARMRNTLPNAFFFGLTGTPINKLDRNTFATFGATEDRSGYMSRYSFADSVSDKATLPLHFEPVPVKLHVDQAAIDEEFKALTDEAGLTEEERSKVAQRVRMAAIMKDPERIKAVCEHIAEHFMTKINPNSFKAQVVCFDRECCVMYKKELDRLLGEATSTIVMDTNNDKADEYRQWRRTREEEAKVLDDFRDPFNPLQIVIVTSKLLTGFDAPILQVMYLDKPMKDHTLLQAICRTNRVYGQDKTYGLIVDYVGIFDDVAKALSFDAEAVEKIISDIEKVKRNVPELVAACVQFFPGVDRTRDDWEGLVAAQECLPNDEMKDRFGAQYRALNRVWNALSPDSCLNPYKEDYRWLSKVYDSIRPTDERGKMIWSALGPKTIQLVHENISVESVSTDEEVLAMDAEIIQKFIEGDAASEKKRKKLEMDLAAVIRKHHDDPRFIALGERMERLREEHEAGLLTSMEFLKALLALAKDVAQYEKETVPEEEANKGKAALTALFQNVRNDNTPVIVERIVNDIDGIVRIVRFPGWQNTSTGRKDVSKNLRDIIMRKYRIKDQEVFNKAYS